MAAKPRHTLVPVDFVIEQTRDKVAVLEVVEALKQKGPSRMERKLAVLFPGQREVKLQRCDNSAGWTFIFDNADANGILVAAEDQFRTDYDRVELIGDEKIFCASFLVRDCVPTCVLNLMHVSDPNEPDVVLEGIYFYNCGREGKTLSSSGKVFRWMRID